MGLLDFLDPEESVGRLWHRLVGEGASYPGHPEAAVALDDLRGILAVFFRGLGGDKAVQVTAGAKESSRHRAKLRQRLGMSGEKLERPLFDGESLRLPPVINLFPTADLNRDLYFWLAAYFVHLPAAEPAEGLAGDLAELAQADAAVRATLAAHPRLIDRYGRLCAAFKAIRPKRSLPPAEASVEAIILEMLDGRPFDAGILAGQATPRRYRPFLPVPLWGGRAHRPPSEARTGEEEMGGEAAEGDDRKRKAARRRLDQAEREDSLILNNMEKILGLAEAVNLNRAVDDDDQENARKAADDLDEVTVSPHSRRAATKLRLDLDLAPDALAGEALRGRHTYPEWDCGKGVYRPDFCSVITGPAPEEGEDWTPDAETQRRIDRVRRQFEALRPKREVLRRQVDGFDLDMDALVRSRSDLAAGGTGSNGVYLDARNQARDMAVALLVDVSLSTDAWIEGHRVLDIEKEALSVLASGISACGDDHAIYTFTSRKRDFVRVETVKTFDEPLGPTVRRRIAALKPGYYTRIGAALRHVAKELAERPNRHRLILLLTDGKPNDIDHYESRYAVEDTRKAVQEARRAGLAVFGVTVDVKARDYFPYLFGRGGYHIVGHASRLSAALPKIYRQLVAS